jgi:hypothetical protein
MHWSLWLIPPRGGLSTVPKVPPGTAASPLLPLRLRPVPSGFNAGFLAFAKATYSFADGHRLRVEAVRSCRAR